MKPSDFILNSDYLTIAQTDSSEFTVTIGGGSLVVGGSTEQNIDFNVKTEKGAVDRILIKKDNGDYVLGAWMRLEPKWEGDPYDSRGQKVAGFCNVYRVSANTLRFQLVLENFSSDSTSTYPAMAFTIKVSSFKPPNIF